MFIVSPISDISNPISDKTFLRFSIVIIYCSLVQICFIYYLFTSQCPVLSLPTRFINPADCMAEMSRFIVFSETPNIDARLGIFTGTFTGSFFCCIVNFTLSFSKLRYFYRVIYWDILVSCFVSYTCS